MKKKQIVQPITTVTECPHCNAPVKPGQTYCKSCYFTLPGCEEYEAMKTSKLAKKSKLGFSLFKRKTVLESEKPDIDKLLDAIEYPEEPDVLEEDTSSEALESKNEEKDSYIEESDNHVDAGVRVIHADVGEEAHAEENVPNFGTEDLIEEAEILPPVEEKALAEEKVPTQLTTDVVKDIAERAGVDIEPLDKTNIGMSFAQKMITIHDDKSNLEKVEEKSTCEPAELTAKDIEKSETPEEHETWQTAIQSPKPTELQIKEVISENVYTEKEREQINDSIKGLNERIASGENESIITRARLRDAEEILRDTRTQLDDRENYAGDTGVEFVEPRVAGENTDSFLRELEIKERACEKERENKRHQLKKELEEEHGKIVSSLEYELEKVRQIALYDELTGLKNRHAFDEDAKSFDLKNLTILSIDVNNLKPTNDNYGHAYGDRLLTSVAEALSEIYGSECYRTGGDEFIVVLDGIRNKVLEKRKTDLDEILKRKEAAFDVDIPISIAYGVGIGNGVKTLKEIIDEADAQMYRDKESIKALQRQIARDMEEVYVPVSELNITTSESSVPNFGTKIEKKELPQGADFVLSEVIEHKQAPRNTEKKDDDFYINSEFHRQLHFFVLYVVKNFAISSIMVAILIWLKNVNI